jgi:hypothetical protein
MDARVASSGRETAAGDPTEDSARAQQNQGRRPHDCIHVLDHPWSDRNGDNSYTRSLRLAHAPMIAFA